MRKVGCERSAEFAGGRVSRSCRNNENQRRTWKCLEGEGGRRSPRLSLPGRRIVASVRFIAHVPVRSRHAREGGGRGWPRVVRKHGRHASPFVPIATRSETKRPRGGRDPAGGGESAAPNGGGSATGAAGSSGGEEGGGDDAREEKAAAWVRG